MTSIESFGFARSSDSTGVVSLPWFGRAWRKMAWTLAKIAVLIGLTGIVLDVAAMLVGPRRPEAPQAAAAAPWTEVNHPFQLYALVGTDLAKLPLAYRARRNVVGGGRQDDLSFGDLKGQAPYLHLFFYRPGAEAAEPLPFSSDLARLGIESDLAVGRSGAIGSLATRFGGFEVQDLRLADHRVSTPCLGFRLAPSRGAPLRIAGFLCGTAEKPVGRDVLGCVVDKIDLVSAGDDVALRRMFVEAERRRGPACAPAPLVEAGFKATWLDANASLPPLKGLLGQSVTPR